ncbi:MAG: hypothetical protein NC043_04660 [Muribaculaceae bacterium]|nr:hypothetical protein [Muribaculaceae bacterium]
MSHLLLYNPWNDLALASGLDSYTPPAAARDMALGGALFPLWWAEKDDSVLAPQHMAEAAETMRKRYGLHGTIGHKADTAAPWGWSAATRRTYLTHGMPPEALPSQDQIEEIRRLSHRRTTIEMHRLLGMPPDECPYEASSTAEAMERIAHLGRAVVKLPWSCSGRGVMFTARHSTDELARRLEGMIRRQGSVLIEPEYSPKMECAALYYADDGMVTLRGFSRFLSSADGRYGGNIVAPQAHIKAMLGHDITDTAVCMAGHLETIIGDRYSGWIGVDMLLHSHGLNPCMEINMRMTMGVAAMYVAGHLCHTIPEGVMYTAPALASSSHIDLSPTGTGMTVALENARSMVYSK